MHAVARLTTLQLRGILMPLTPGSPLGGCKNTYEPRSMRALDATGCRKAVPECMMRQRRALDAGDPGGIGCLSGVLARPYALQRKGIWMPFAANSPPGG